jgi:cytochrome c biogenesis protein CcmG, thiol:disulfide interchange protein DsbE
VALAIAVATTTAVWWFVRVGEGPRVGVGEPAPRIVGTTLDGEAFDLATYAGRPVVLNFWGPTCVPCRDEFPLLAAKLVAHADDDLAVIGVLTNDPAPLARDFVAEFGATWPTVEDPDKTWKGIYQVLGRPQTFFIDASGVVRSVQIGEVRDTDFETHYARIAP